MASQPPEASNPFLQARVGRWYKSSGRGLCRVCFAVVWQRASASLSICFLSVFGTGLGVQGLRVVLNQTRPCLQPWKSGLTLRNGTQAGLQRSQGVLLLLIVLLSLLGVSISLSCLCPRRCFLCLSLYSPKENVINLLICSYQRETRKSAAVLHQPKSSPLLESKRVFVIKHSGSSLDPPTSSIKASLSYPVICPCRL